MANDDRGRDEIVELRRQAEIIAQGKRSRSSKELDYMSSEEIRQVLHELQVHQIELEMQNEELREAQAELNIVKERIFDLYDLTPVGHVTVSEQGLILEANLSACALLGVVRGALVTQPISRFIHKDDQDIYYLHRKRLYSAYATYLDQSHGPLSVELRMKNEHENTPIWVNMVTTLVRQPDGMVASRIILNDITDRKLLESYKEMGKKILRALNAPDDTKDLIRQVISILQNDAGFDAVGIRLQEGEDFPYYDQTGFSPDFLQIENSLVKRTVDGGLCRDKDGRVNLECTCGLVISGRTDPTSPLFTPGGSCWTNNSSDLLEIPRDKDPRQNPRNLCVHQGYVSVALVPIRDHDRIIGLIQLNDRQKGRFSQEIVEEMEAIASQIGVTLMRKRAEEERINLGKENIRLQKTESLSRMAEAIAHHFNNQLAVVMGNLEVAIDDLPRNTETGGILIAAMRGARNAVEVSRLMLTYLGQTTGKYTLLDLSNTCRQSLPLLQAAMPENVTLKVDFLSPGPIINSNESLIQQVLTNLGTNALGGHRQ